MTESDVKLVGTPTHQTAQVLATKDVDAIGAWQPNSGQALKSVPGSKAVFSSADEPGLIYDFVSVSPQSLAGTSRRLGEVREGVGSRGQIPV
jgi:NitT/TauT family transport system substrate-binding protein